MNEINYWIHAVTPLHVGAGRGLGYIDMPITREKVTTWPYIPGSSIKGVIADHFGASDEDARMKDRVLKAAFGTSGSDNDCAAGALVFTDANILCLPIRSFYGTFAWVTSPFCLKRTMNITLSDLFGETNAFITENSCLTDNDGKIYLEDIDINASKNDMAGNIAKKIADSVFSDDAGRKFFAERFAVVSDDIFTFLCESGTEVNAHIRIDSKTGIVKDGALWYEESLPVESILTGRVWCDKVYVKDIDKDITEEYLFERFCGKELALQVGGKASTGKGLVRCIFGSR